MGTGCGPGKRLSCRVPLLQGKEGRVLVGSVGWGPKVSKKWSGEEITISDDRGTLTLSALEMKGGDMSLHPVLVSAHQPTGSRLPG